MSLYKIGRAISHWLSFPSPSNKFQYGTLKAQISRFFARGTRGATWRRFSMAHLYLTFSRPIQRYQPRVNATSGKSKYPSVPSFALHNVNLVGVYVAYGHVSVGWSLSLLKNCSFFCPARRDLLFEPMLVALSPAVTKLRHYRSEAQKISAQCSRGLWEDVLQIWSNCDEK